MNRYIRYFFVFFVLIILAIPYNAWPESYFFAESKRVSRMIGSDFKDYYSLDNLGKVGMGLLFSGSIANTRADENFQDWVQDSVVSDDTNDFSKAVKDLGSWKQVTPIYLGIAASGYVFKHYGFMEVPGTWAGKTFRALFVGMPSILFWQFALGAGRPSDGEGSEWHPGEDNNSASGHTFTGAVPFLTAGKMADNVCLKSLFYIGSTFTGFSRINDNQHYVSQTLLGWWLAFLAVESVDKTDKQNIQVMPVPVQDGFGITVTYHF